MIQNAVISLNKRGDLLTTAGALWPDQSLT
jgi:hypothetical protein